MFHIFNPALVALASQAIAKLSPSCQQPVPMKKEYPKGSFELQSQKKQNFQQMRIWIEVGYGRQGTTGRQQLCLYLSVYGGQYIYVVRRMLVFL